MTKMKWEKGGLKTPIARARGLGSAKEGVKHWMAQRFTAILNIPLTIWFVYQIFNAGFDVHGMIPVWMNSPVNSGLLILFTISIFYHAMLGVQVVIEDYVHNEFLKIILIVLQKGGLMLGATISIFSILHLAHGF